MCAGWDNLLKFVNALTDVAVSICNAFSAGIAALFHEANPTNSIPMPSII